MYIFIIIAFIASEPIDRVINETSGVQEFLFVSFALPQEGSSSFSMRTTSSTTTQYYIISMLLIVIVIVDLLLYLFLTRKTWFYPRKILQNYSCQRQSNAT